MKKKDKLEVIEETEEFDFESLDEEPEEKPVKQKKTRKSKKETTTKKVKKEKYKPNPKYKIKEFCDSYLMYYKEDKQQENLILTFNTYFQIIYISPMAEDEAITEIEAFIKSKGHKTYRHMYSKGDPRKAQKDLTK